MALCPQRSQSTRLPDGQVNWVLGDKRIIDVLQVCFIYKTFSKKSQERKTRFELATTCLEGRDSTVELLPQLRQS